MNCLIGSSEYMTVFSSFTRASFLNMRADQSSSWLIRTSFPKSTILRHYSLCKMSKNGKTSPHFIFIFEHCLDLFRTDFYALFKSKIASCIVDIENHEEILLALLTFDLRLRTWLTAAEDVIFGFNAFYRWIRASGMTVGANLLLNFLVFDRLRTSVTVEADILSSLIVFYDWFCKRANCRSKPLFYRQLGLSIMSSLLKERPGEISRSNWIQRDDEACLTKEIKFIETR